MANNFRFRTIVFYNKYSLSKEIIKIAVKEKYTAEKYQ